MSSIKLRSGRIVSKVFPKFENKNSKLSNETQSQIPVNAIPNSSCTVINTIENRNPSSSTRYPFEIQSQNPNLEHQNYLNNNEIVENQIINNENLLENNDNMSEIDEMEENEIANENQNEPDENNDDHHEDQNNRNDNLKLIEVLTDGLNKFAISRQTEPPQYNRDLPFNIFLKVLEEYMDQIKIPNERKKALLFKHLGTPEQQVFLDIDPEGKATYKMVTEALTERFGMANNSQKARSEYNKLAQYSYESLTEYADRCRRVTNIAFQSLKDAKDRESLAVEKFIRGVQNAYVRQQLIIANDTSLIAATQRAKRIADSNIDLIEVNQITKTSTEIPKNNHEKESKNNIRRPCVFCERTNHIAKYCFYNPNGIKNSNRQQGNIQNEINKQRRTFPDNFTTNTGNRANVECYTCGKKGHISRFCWNNKNQSKNIKTGDGNTSIAQK